MEMTPPSPSLSSCLQIYKPSPFLPILLCGAEVTTPFDGRAPSVRLRTERERGAGSEEQRREERDPPDEDDPPSVLQHGRAPEATPASKRRGDEREERGCRGGRRGARSHLFAQALDVCLGQGLALLELGDPLVDLHARSRVSCCRSRVHVCMLLYVRRLCLPS